MGVPGEVRGGGGGGGGEGGCKSALTRSRSVGKNSVTSHFFKGGVGVCVGGGGGGGRGGGGAGRTGGGDRKPVSLAYHIAQGLVQQAEFD